MGCIYVPVHAYIKYMYMYRVEVRTTKKQYQGQLFCNKQERIKHKTFNLAYTEDAILF